MERFHPLPNDVWAAIVSYWRLKPFKRGEHVTRAGETERRFGFILEGTQRAYFLSPDGSEHTIAFMYANDPTGVPDSLFFQQPSAVSIEALSPGQMATIAHEDLAALLDHHRALERWAMYMFMWGLSGRFKRERDMLSLTAQERYERLLRDSPQLLQIAPLRHIASYLGMSPETLSRVRAATS